MSLEGSLRELRRLREQVELQLGKSLPAPGAADDVAAKDLLTPRELFGRRVHDLRIQHGLRLDDVALATGISKAYLSQVENARVDPPRDEKVLRLEELFGQRPQTLVEMAHMAAVPEDIRRRLELLKAGFERAENVIGQLVSRMDPATVAEVMSPSTAAPKAGVAGVPEGARQQDEAAEKSREPSVQFGAEGDGASIDGLGCLGGSNVGRVQPVRKAVPIINRVAAGYPMEFTDLGYPVGVADDYISMPPGLEDPTAFAVRVVGDSMQPRYHEGDIVIFSPRADIRSGDDCYVRFVTNAEIGEGATFKRVYFDGPTTIRLQPLNDRFPPMMVPGEQVDGMYKAVCRYERL